MKQRRSFSTAMLDIITNTLLVFVLVAAIALTQTTKPKDADIEAPPAEFLIHVSWDDDRDVDIDSWLECPNGAVLYFQNKEGGLAHLERDDTGHEKIMLPNGGLKTDTSNYELFTIRNVVQGEWVFNLHLFSFGVSMDPIDVQVTITKLNPTAEVIYDGVITMSQPWEERTVLRFTTDDDGDVVSTSELPKSLVDSEALMRYEGRMNQNSTGGV